MRVSRMYSLVVQNDVREPYRLIGKMNKWNVIKVIGVPIQVDVHPILQNSKPSLIRSSRMLINLYRLIQTYKKHIHINVYIYEHDIN